MRSTPSISLLMAIALALMAEIETTDFAYDVHTSGMRDWI
jgi:hypothetical protein